MPKAKVSDIFKLLTNRKKGLEGMEATIAMFLCR
jgi:hypothetical protein